MTAPVSTPRQEGAPEPTNTEASVDSRPETVLENVEHGNELVKRHDYAIVCWADKEFTRECSGKGFYCDSQGALSNKNKADSEKYVTCKFGCDCIDLSPKQQCMVGISGQSYCARDETIVGKTTQISAVLTPYRSPETIRSSESLALEAAATALQPRSNIKKRHNYAMVCDDKINTNGCQRYWGYYCDGLGRVRHTDTAGFSACNQLCVCIDLQPKSYCLFGLSGQSYCPRGLAIGEERTAGALSTKYLEPRSNIEKRHDYALVCSDKENTVACHKYWGYFCDGSGQAKFTDRVEFHKCNSLCLCVDLQPKKNCLVGLTGQSWCIRDLGGNSEVDQPVRALPTPSVTGLERRNEDDPSAENTAEAASSPSTATDVEKRGAFRCLTGLSGTSYCMRDETGLEIEVEPGVPIAQSLEKRVGSWPPIMKINQYVMICAGDGRYTSECQRTGGWFCTTEDKLDKQWDNGKGDGGCFFECVCFDQAPKPNCVLGLTGMTYCLRDDGQGWDEELSEGASGALLDTQALHTRKTRDLELELEPRYGNPWNNYVMVCASSQKGTAICQSKYGYYCSSAGRLSRQYWSPGSQRPCEEYCRCQNLSPKPLCVFGISGAAYCMRGGHPHPDAHTELIRRGEQLPASADDHSLEPQNRAEHAWGFGNNYAMICMNDRESTNTCQSKGGYYCDSDGQIQRQKDKGYLGRLLTCEDACFCQDLFPKAPCVLGVTGMTYCLRSDTNEAAIPPQQESPPPDVDPYAPLSIVDQADGRNDYAMVCFNSRKETNLCQRNGYYCDSKGGIQRQEDRGQVLGCIDYCWCQDLYTKPACVLGVTGMTYCLRDLLVGALGWAEGDPEMVEGPQRGHTLGKRGAEAVNNSDQEGKDTVALGTAEPVEHKGGHGGRPRPAGGSSSSLGIRTKTPAWAKNIAEPLGKLRAWAAGEGRQRTDATEREDVVQAKQKRVCVPNSDGSDNYCVGD